MTALSLVSDESLSWGWSAKGKFNVAGRQRQAALLQGAGGIIAITWIIHSKILLDRDPVWDVLQISRL